MTDLYLLFKLQAISIYRDVRKIAPEIMEHIKHQYINFPII